MVKAAALYAEDVGVQVPPGGLYGLEGKTQCIRHIPTLPLRLTARR